MHSANDSQYGHKPVQAHAKPGINWPREIAGFCVGFGMVSLVLILVMSASQ